MPTTCTVVTVKNKLLTLLSTGLSGVQLTYSHPGDAARGEFIFFGNARGESTYPVFVAGRKPRHERYDLAIHIVVTKPGTSSAESAETRALELMAEVENVIADDPTLAMDLGNFGAKVSSFDIDSSLSENGWVTVITLQVTVEARLS